MASKNGRLVLKRRRAKPAFGDIETRLTASKEEGGKIEVGGQEVALGIPDQLRQMGRC